MSPSFLHQDWAHKGPQYVAERARGHGLVFAEAETTHRPSMMREMQMFSQGAKSSSKLLLKEPELLETSNAVQTDTVPTHSLPGALHPPTTPPLRSQGR